MSTVRNPILASKYLLKEKEAILLKEMTDIRRGAKNQNEPGTSFCAKSTEFLKD